MEEENISKKWFIEHLEKRVSEFRTEPDCEAQVRVFSQMLEDVRKGNYDSMMDQYEAIRIKTGA